jgi:hypothetical protein
MISYTFIEGLVLYHYFDPDYLGITAKKSVLLDHHVFDGHLDACGIA